MYQRVELFERGGIAKDALPQFLTVNAAAFENRLAKCRDDPGFRRAPRRDDFVPHRVSINHREAAL